MKRLKGIEFKEGNSLIRTLSGDELLQSYRLRHKVFAETLKWVPTTSDQREMDLFDLWGTTVGLLRDDGKLIGMARLLPSSGQFMLEKDLCALLPAGYTIRKNPDTAEITRLAIDPEIYDKGLSTRILLTVLKGIYQWAVENNIRYYYLEVEQRFLRILRALGFPCEQIGEAIALPPAEAPSVAALYDMVRFDEENKRKRPEFLRWMTTVELPTGLVVSDRTLGACGDGVLPVLSSNQPWDKVVSAEKEPAAA
jgi:acyl homoserine lactone synthase